VQNVEGNIINTDKESYTVGPTLNAQVDLGEAIYKNLASKQLVKAAASGFEAQQQESLSMPLLPILIWHAQRLPSPLRPKHGASHRNTSIKLSGLSKRVSLSKATLCALRSNSRKNLLVLRQADEHQRIAAARFVQVLHLDPGLELVTAKSELLPLQIVNTNTSLETLITKALASHPDIAQTHLA